MKKKNVGNYINPRVPGQQNVSKCRSHHTVETYVHKGKQLKTGFSYMGQNVKKGYIFAYLRGPVGGGGLQ